MCGLSCIDFFLRYFVIDYHTGWKSTVFPTRNEKTSEIYVLQISNDSSSKLHTFSCFTPRKWLWKQVNSLLQHALKLCVTKHAVQRHAVWCVASDFAQKDILHFADSSHKQQVNDLYKSRWKSWRLTNHSARIVMLVLQNGFWLANL